MCDWLNATESKLQAAPRYLTLTRIAKESGLSLSWLSDFAQGKIEDPGVKKVKILHDYLSGNIPPFDKRCDFDELASADSEYNKGVDYKWYCVYFVYADKELLYVGCTKAVVNRLRTHVGNKKFTGYTPTHVDFVWFEGDNHLARIDALRYESLCIKNMQPPLNKAGK